MATQDPGAPRHGVTGGQAGSRDPGMSQGGGPTSATREGLNRPREQAGEVVGKAQEQAKSTISSQKDRAAGSLHAVADALRGSGHQMREQDQASVGSYMERAADRVERLSRDLRDKDVEELVDDVEGLARREPELFIGGAVLLGVLAARFLKSSGRQRRTRTYSAPYEREYEYATTAVPPIPPVRTYGS